MNKIVFYTLCVCFFLGVSACSSRKSLETKQVVDLPLLSCVAVLPVAVPITGSDAISKEISESLQQGARSLDSILMEKFGAQPEFKVLSANQLDAILPNPWGGRISQIQDIGRATGCGGVLETSIGRYRKRVGGELSVETPAAAAFSMALTGVEQGVRIWSTSFDEEQKALFEDIFSFGKAERRAFKWLSVQDLLRDGVDSRLAEFPYFQEIEE